MSQNILASGTVKSADGEYALAGITVVACLPAGFPNLPGASLSAPLEIARTRSVVQGRFELSWDENSPGKPYLCYLEHCAGPAVLLQCLDQEGQVLSQTEPLALEALHGIELSLPAGDWSPSKGVWRKLSVKMQQAQIMSLGALASELVDLRPSGVFSDLSAQQRLGLLASLEQAVVDPDNQLSQADLQPRIAQLEDEATRLALRSQVAQKDIQGLTEVFDNAVVRANLAGGHLQASELLLDLKGFEAGDVQTGVGRFLGERLFENTPLNQSPRLNFPDLFPWLQNPVVGYRDYLVNIWVQRATQQLAGQTLTAAGAVEQLNRRFHQDFTTKDTTEQPANRLLHDILLRALKAPVGMDFGFGVAPGDIKPQEDLGNRAYLDYLIGRTGVEQRELENRYRLNLSKSDLDISHPVQQNIDTLQRFFSDSFQCAQDPSAIAPVLTGNGLPIINEFTYPTQAHGPFFWQYEEWLDRNEPFYAENYFDIRTLFNVSVMDTASKDTIWGRTMPLAQFLSLGDSSNELRQLNPPANSTTSTYSQELKISDQWARNLVELKDWLNDAHKDYFAGVYPAAEAKYVELLKASHQLIVRLGRWKGTAWDKYNPSALAAEQRALAIKDSDALDTFEKKYHTKVGYFLSGNVGQNWLGDTEKARVPYLIDMVFNRMLPACLAETRLAQGKYLEVVHGGAKPFGYDASGYPKREPSLVTVTQFDLFTGPAPTEAGAKATPPDTVWWPPYQINGGSLPYSSSTAVDKQRRFSTTPAFFPANAMEKSWFRLKLGEALLDWADQLYRTDQANQVNRARELYKAVLFLHGEDPNIEPNWGSFQWWINKPQTFGRLTRNPRLTSQINRAQIGFEQINVGLNYYGYDRTYLPPVRYRALRDAAQSFAASAKNMQNDYLAYMDKYEQSLLDEMSASVLIEKAGYSLQVADEQVQIAQSSVVEAQKQVEGVKAQIEAKRKEIKDSEGFFSQLTDFLGGLKDAAFNLGKSALGSMNEEEGEAAGGTIDYAALYKVISTKGGTTAATAGLTGTMALTAGYGAFIYAGITSMQSLEAASNKRAGELKTLQDVALPAAEKQVQLKQREARIAGLNKAIAQADFNFGRKLLAFYQQRFLSKAFWQQLSGFANRLMRRYADLGGRTAWFAERALSFEIDKDIRVVSFDYFPKQLRGVTGADTLQLHLAEMEAARIHGLSNTVPVKQTYSLVRDFPIAFGQLKKLGRCTFSTSELPLQQFYPGLYGYRLRCISVGATYAKDTMPHKGLLTNPGLSVLSRRDGSQHRLLRYPDALPLSEFNMRSDMWVYDLPDETLLTFEGSGLDTQWGLSLSTSVGASSLESLTDVLLTFDMRASYAASLDDAHREGAPKVIQKSLLLSGRAQTPGEINRFKLAGDLLTLRFEPGTAAHNSTERMRTVSLIGLMLSGVSANQVMARLTAELDGISVDFALSNGIALSNSGFLAAGNAGAPLPLNALVGARADQPFVLTIDPAANPGVQWSGLYDLQALFEYQAQV